MDEKIRETLTSLTLFDAIGDDPKNFDIIAAAMSSRTIKAGTKVIREGEAGNEMFVLMRGELNVARTTVKNEPYSVAHLTDANHPYFGEGALIDEDIRSASIVAVTDCEVLVMNRADFNNLCDSYPAIGLAIYRVLAKQLSQRSRASGTDVLLLFEALVKEVEAREME